MLVCVESSTVKFTTWFWLWYQPGLLLPRKVATNVAWQMLAIFLSFSVS